MIFLIIINFKIIDLNTYNPEFDSFEKLKTP